MNKMTLDAKPKRILISGTFCSLNKGDAAMRIALIDLLSRAIPSCNIVLMTPFPQLDEKFYNNSVISHCSRRNPRKAATMIMRSLCWHLSHRLLGIKFNRILDKELSVYYQSDVIVDLSGDGITEEYGIKCLASHLVPVILGKLFCKPVFICAQTIGPLTKTGFLCRYLLKKVDKISAREQLTLEYLASLGLNGIVSPTADLAFLMKPSTKERALEILTDEGASFDKPLIGFSVSGLPGNVRGNKDSTRPAEYERAIAEVLNKAVDAGLQPVLISHSTGPGEKYDDRCVAMRVAELASNYSQIVVIKGDYSAEETKGVISQMEMFVGVRLHSCIAAMSTGVPAVCIAYGSKAYGIMRSAGQDRWVIDISQVTGDRLSTLVKEAWEQRAATRETLKREIPLVKALAEQNVQTIMQFLDDCKQ